MNFKELQSKLQNSTKSKISLTEIGNALGIKLSTVSIRAKNDSELKYSEIKKIENYFGVNLLNNTELSVPAFKNEKIQYMIKNSGLGIAAYGIYCAIIEMMSEKEIIKGSEKLIADELLVNEKAILSVLNDFNLFDIKNNIYYSLYITPNKNQNVIYSKIFDELKKEIYFDVISMLQNNHII